MDVEKIINKDEILEGINIAALNFTEQKSFFFLLLIFCMCFAYFLYTKKLTLSFSLLIRSDFRN